MPIQNIFKLIVLHIFFIFLGLCVFVTLFHTPLFITIDVLFYRGLILLFLSSFILCLVMWVTKKYYLQRFLTSKDMVVTLSLFFSFSLVFFTLVPVTLDRSVSTFILRYMSTHEHQTFTTNDMAVVLTQQYIYQDQGVQKRFHEQVVSKNITQTGNSYRITKQGILLMNIFKLIGSLFNITIR